MPSLARNYFVSKYIGTLSFTCGGALKRINLTAFQIRQLLVMYQEIRNALNHLEILHPKTRHVWFDSGASESLRSSM
eukprot:6468767-Amphidinium_carterae.1